MSPFGAFNGHEQVVLGSDNETGLRCVIAVHSTRLGPSLGGTRFLPYPSGQAALEDALRLSRAMSYKAACAGLDLGGGKAVILGDPAKLKTERLLRAFGRIVESLNGRYITACDVGTYPDDLEVVARETRWARGRDEVYGGSGDSGILTAWGVYRSIQAVAERLWEDSDVSGLHVAVQGLGKVGSRLVAHLVENGAEVTVADIDDRRVAAVVASHDVTPVPIEKVLSVEADILSPNALGSVLSHDVADALRVQAVCGGANNQLAEDDVADHLRNRGILYAPDFVVNAGGLISVAGELAPGGPNFERSKRQVDQIPATLRTIWEIADERGLSTEAAAIRFGDERIDSVGRLRGFYLPTT